MESVYRYLEQYQVYYRSRETTVEESAKEMADRVARHQAD